MADFSILKTVSKSFVNMLGPGHWNVCIPSILEPGYGHKFERGLRFSIAERSVGTRFSLGLWLWGSGMHLMRIFCTNLSHWAPPTPRKQVQAPVISLHEGLTDPPALHEQPEKLLKESA